MTFLQPSYTASQVSSKERVGSHTKGFLGYTKRIIDKLTSAIFVYQRDYYIYCTRAAYVVDGNIKQTLFFFKVVYL